MIVGDPSAFAIESEISCAFERVSFRALGFFVIHLGGKIYGVKSADATLLACSFEQVGTRIAARGKHVAPFSCHRDSGKIADAITSAIYGPESDDINSLGVSQTEVREVAHSNGVVWAPDGDEAFDDGSCVLQFDFENRVRLIGFKRKNHRHEPSTLQDVWLEADSFYRLLSQWRSEFLAAWAAAPKQATAISKGEAESWLKA